MSEPDEADLIRDAHERLRILDALVLALEKRRDIWDLVDAASSADDARSRLRETLGLDEVQATAILDMQLRRFSRRERQRILDEVAEIRRRLAELEA